MRAIWLYIGEKSIFLCCVVIAVASQTHGRSSTKIKPMNRKVLYYLLEWLSLSQRKPLVIRGVRQVGKTWVVRELAKRSQLKTSDGNTIQYPLLSIPFCLVGQIHRLLDVALC